MSKARRPGDGSKTAGSGATILNSEVHHWWPRALSSFWAGSDGSVSQLRFDGNVHRSAPESFGGINNAHAIKLSGPWNGTIEGIFNFVDDQLPRLVSAILDSLPECGTAIRNPKDRNQSVRPYPMGPEAYATFAEGLASLVLRSPGFRNYARNCVNDARALFSAPPVGPRDNLIALQIHHWYSIAVSSFQNANIALVRSGDSEFILGEGYLNNISGPNFTPTLRAVIPLTPGLAAICFSGSGHTPPEKVCSVWATREDVIAINYLAQIYSKDFVYFRAQHPEIIEAFKMNQFLELKDHRAEVIEEFIEAVRYAPNK